MSVSVNLSRGCQYLSIEVQLIHFPLLFHYFTYLYFFITLNPFSLFLKNGKNIHSVEYESKLHNSQYIIFFSKKITIYFCFLFFLSMFDRLFCLEIFFTIGPNGPYLLTFLLENINSFNLTEYLQNCTLTKYVK